MRLSKIFESELLAKIVVFFHQHSSIIDTSRGVATWLGQDEEKIKTALEELVEFGILVAHRTSSTIGYAYTHNKELLTKIDKLIKKKGLDKVVFPAKGKIR